MIFEEDDEEKKLLEDIRFKRNVQFVDDNCTSEINIDSFNKQTGK